MARTTHILPFYRLAIDLPSPPPPPSPAPSFVIPTSSKGSYSTSFWFKVSNGRRKSCEKDVRCDRPAYAQAKPDQRHLGHLPLQQPKAVLQDAGLFVALQLHLSGMYTTRFLLFSVQRKSGALGVELHRLMIAKQAMMPCNTSRVNTPLSSVLNRHGAAILELTRLLLSRHVSRSICAETFQSSML